MTSLLLFGVFAALAAAMPTPDANSRDLKMALHETLAAAPAAFVKAGAASPETVLNLRIALVQSDPAGLEQALYSVSTPSSPQYGKHLSKAQVEAFVAPVPGNVEAVNEWLGAHGIKASPISPAGDWLGFSASVQQANALLDADFSVFTHADSGEQTVRTLSYSIPVALKDKLDVVHPTVFFPSHIHAQRTLLSAPLPRTIPLSSRDHDSLDQRDGVPASCETKVTPACLQAIYGIPSTRSSSSNSTSNAIGVAGFINQFANANDLEDFLDAYRPDLSSDTSFGLLTLDGGQNPQNATSAGVEANLDIQYTVGIANGVPTFFISEGTDTTDGGLEGFLDMVNFVLAMETPPSVFTTSYGDNENNFSPALAGNLCNAYAQLGARGVTVLFASGDSGSTTSEYVCTNAFAPTFPSGCPFLTSVGSTTGIDTERASNFSAGGFSNYFPTPAYQAGAVSSYLKSLPSASSASPSASGSGSGSAPGPLAGRFNASGRAYPDLAAQGEHFVVVVGGTAYSVSGTSASCPVVAAVVALLNDALGAAGRAPLGFLNPWLYSDALSGGALRDVLQGDSIDLGCNVPGYGAVTGWDPVTGLGTPDYAKLLATLGL